jgi:hypothetical protein
MATEPSTVTEARALLSQFESQMDRPEGLAHLSEALSLLADVRDAASSTHLVKLVSNIVFSSYATKLQKVYVSLGERSPSIHNDILGHWIKVHTEFEDSGFEMPPGLDYDFWKMLLDKETLGKFSRLSPVKRRAFLEGLFGDKAPQETDRNRNP